MSLKKTATKRKKKSEKLAKTRRAENLFVAPVALVISPILLSILISKQNMTVKYLKVPSEEKTERPKKEDALKMYFMLITIEKNTNLRRTLTIKK